MGTQTAIAEKIILNKADYILALKGNQKGLQEEAESLFRIQKPESVQTEIEKGHGRIESRTCEVIQKLQFLFGKEKWPNLTSIVRIISERTLRNKSTTETRYYISSIDANAQKFNHCIRTHWGVENSLHWTLDMVFGEDLQRKRNGKAAQNFALIQKIALNLIKRNSSKGSIKAKRLRAGWDNAFLIEILQI